MLVMAVGAGPLSFRTDIFVSDKVGFLPSSGGTAEIIRSLSCLIGDKGVFLFLEEIYYETMACFKIIFDLKIYFERNQL